jgi:hypothetical protein
MSNFILTGMFTEGTTDVRFLESVVKKTLDDLAFECTGDIETELKIIEIDKTGLSFNEQVFLASKTAKEEYDVLMLFIHTDADYNDDSVVFNSKIIPAKTFLDEQDDKLVCKKVIAIVPIQMTEAWMLADKNLLKDEIGIEGTDIDLGIHRRPEETNNPKAVIENIIRLSKENQVKRKRRTGLNISDLYQIIGQKIELSELENLPSYNKFKSSLREVLKELNFLHN